ncbi:hypothetical protein PUNSTDRAFT_97678 [Punctularia strigosozonata HHB-11173 SS5]|uniref:uncharacterized protein n=1 Tax=Punctularia strigosozonata (strain HHB-11173) TaxID=741275 RepID=UPI0004417343|nr:uncharacterized protein PUNSTDRAFT_97678 [Punctularia strigosozonata HHB-11173 SS5]EIN12799.1 hypothetical protein PUNSTDRAFT_97678 [Punctularia strigosozonata HHB-11173 SS5]
MFATRLVLAFLALFAFVMATFASPVAPNVTVVDLDKRITHTGRGTYFYVGLGNCGYTDVDSSPIVAISTERYGSGGNCNQWIHITNTANGKTAYGKTRDSCPGCGENDLDMSPSLFEQLGSLDTGVLKIEWHFEAKGWSP